MYEIVFFVQAVAQFQLPIVFCTCSSVFLSSAVLIAAQYDVLFCSLKNLQFTAMIGSGKYRQHLRKASKNLNLKDDAQASSFFIALETVDTELEAYLSEEAMHLHKKRTGPNDTYLMELVPDLEEALNECIRHHQAIVRCCDKLEDVASPFILVKSIELSFQICILALTFMKSTGTSMVENLNIIQYLMLTLIDLFIVSYMGQVIQNQSVRVRDFLFETPWYLFGGPIRRSMLIMQLYTLRPKVITGGRFFIMGYDKCIAVNISQRKIDGMFHGMWFFVFFRL